MTEERKQNNTPIIIVLLVSILLNAFFAFQIYQSNLSPKARAAKKAQIELEVVMEQLSLNKDSLLQELEKTKQSLDNQLLANQDLVANNEVLSEQVNDQYAKIKSLLYSASRSNSNSAQLAQAKAELDKLKNSEKEYLSQIESLKSTLLANTSELEEYKKNLLESLSKQDESEGEEMEEVVSSEITVTDLKISGIRINRGQAQEISKAKKVKFLKIDYNIMPNGNKESVDKTFYIKIINSLGEVLNSDTDIQMKESENIYTLEQSFVYAGEQISESISYTHGQPLKSGKYSVEIIENGKALAIGDFLLK